MGIAGVVEYNHIIINERRILDILILREFVLKLSFLMRNCVFLTYLRERKTFFLLNFVTLRHLKNTLISLNAFRELQQKLPVDGMSSEDILSST